MLCHVAIRMVDAVSISRLPYACGSVHQPGGRPPSHALPGSTRTDEVRNQRLLFETSHSSNAGLSLKNSVTLVKEAAASPPFMSFIKP